MPKDWTARLDRVNFRCGECRYTFAAVPDLIQDDAETEYHPHRYFAHCPACKAENQPQAAWERALMKAHQEATGPVTDAGKAASASNLAGHPTPQEARLTRFNAMKHGMQARVATYFPAKPEKYTFCAQCEVDRHWCAQQPACVKQTELFMLHHAAVEQRNPKHLGRIHADLISALTASLQLCLQAVLGEGVLIKQPRVELDRDGTPVTLTYLQEDGTKSYIYDFQANPAFKPISDLVSRLGLSMNDLGLTVRAVEGDAGAEMGKLQLDAKAKESLTDFGQRMEKLTAAMSEKLGRSAARTAADPVMIAHKAQGEAA